MCLLGQGHATAAARLLEEAVEILTASGSSPEIRAAAQFGLARALWGVGRAHDRARELVRQARTNLIGVQPNGASLVTPEAIDAWERDPGPLRGRAAIE